MHALSFLFRTLLALFALGFAQVASAQTTYTFVNGTDANLGDTTPCTGPLVRTFSVSNSFTIADVDIGVFATHTWRGDLRMTLQGPDGTRVQIVNDNVNNVDGDNFNVRLNDQGTQVVNLDGSTNHSTTAPPPFQNNFIPNNALSAFNGRNSAGTWRLEICDVYPSLDNGVFRHAELYLTSQPTNYADLSLTKTVSNSTPANGASISYTLNLTNASSSPLSASNVTVRDLLPAGTNYVSYSGYGTYSASTGIWNVASIAPGQTRSLTIQATVNATAGAVIRNVAEVTASSVPDSDSTPNNGATGEDDYASASFTVSGTRTAGIAPTLFCPNGSILFDWDTRSWTQGSTSNTYTLGTLGTMGYTLSNPNGVYLNNAAVGGQSPVLQNIITGGTSPAQMSLLTLVDLNSLSAVVTETITLPRRMAGAQLKIFDVDYAVNQFADRVTVYGRLDGVTVYPTLTNGVANYVIGNTAYGDGNSDNEQAAGNVTATFASAVDTIIIEYGNHALAPSNPGQQGVSVHDILLCNPAANLNVSKTSATISDPVNAGTNPKAIPGALIDYQILVNNTGPSEVDNGSVVVHDDTPADAKMCLADLAGAGSGPVQFVNGTPSSNLAYSFSGLSSTTDALEFSNDNGATWTYVPVPDADNCDVNITDFRVKPTGSFAPNTSFTLHVQFRVL